MMPPVPSAGVTMALAVDSGLHPVSAQTGHAPSPRRRLRSIKKYPAAFVTALLVALNAD
jgi:hypothetical protein